MRKQAIMVADTMATTPADLGSASKTLTLRMYSPPIRAALRYEAVQTFIRSILLRIFKSCDDFIDPLVVVSESGGQSLRTDSVELCEAAENEHPGDPHNPLEDHARTMRLKSSALRVWMSDSPAGVSIRATALILLP